MKSLTYFTTTMSLFVTATTALSSPMYPDGRLGVNMDEYYTFILHVPQGQKVQFKYSYSAAKENQIMIYNMREDTHIRTNNNARGNLHYTEVLFSETKDVDYVITGYSKDCWVGNRNCAQRNWVQEPIKVDERNQTAYFDDSCDPSPGVNCTFDDSQLTWKLID